MSDRMTPIPFGELMHWILSEHETGSVFGVRRAYAADPAKRLELFGEHLETPFGPAAGPHTQLSQNIVAAYYAGARFFELKTVQTLDGEDLPVSKPCILAADECYNVEWSTELRVPQAMEEYIKAWFILKLISREWGLGSPDGFIFNMSVGYNYEGVASPKIDSFIEGLKDASHTAVWAQCREWTLANLHRFSRIDRAYVDGICPRVCTSATLSTLHGCPPTEIERIATHLIQVKKLHTFVKCNPTLLGYAFARNALDEMGYDYVTFDDFHFRDDLQYQDAVPMFKRLLQKAEASGVSFGLKLTNTFPVAIARGELPGEEMYMSGRSLYPLTIELARRISEEFDGKLRLSFSGGADAHNLPALFDAGIWPVTLATTLLKPGGYQRLTQIAQDVAGREYLPFDGVSVGKVAYLAQSALHDPRNRKPIKPAPSRKLKAKVPLTSCFTAPCAHGCPIGQDIPQYVALVGQGRYAEALKLIVEKNPLPSITGRICPHHCADKCTRNFYEESVRIRSAKRAAVKGGFEELIGSLPVPAPTGKRVAVVGGGPGGMAAAFFLARQGARVTLFEKRDALGGVVRYVIPPFRIPNEAIDRDARLLARLGVEIRLNTAAPDAAALLGEGYDAVVLAVGAWAHAKLPLEQGEAMNVIDFLERYKAGTLSGLGKDVAVVGGGNTAMDAARAAKRLPGVERVRLVYRRDQRNMPADEEELRLAQDDGVEFCELLSPVSLTNGKLLCKKMELGQPDASGRRAPVETEETALLSCDTLIAAVGERVDPAPFLAIGARLDGRGRVAADPETLETTVKNVFVIGDANRGPATVVEAIADARRAADAIVGEYAYHIPQVTDAAACYDKQGVLSGYDCAEKEAGRCLDCGRVCQCCVQVCPNRANVSIRVPGESMPQILHVDKMCNECGNCLFFCPYDSAPYEEKLTLFATEAEFDGSQNKGFLPLPDGRVKLRLEEVSTVRPQDASIPGEVRALIAAVLADYRYLL